MHLSHRYTLTTAPTEEPVTLAEAKTQCRIFDTGEDGYLMALIVAARRHIEAITGRQICTATWKLNLDEFPAWAIELRRFPLQAIGSIKYYDTSAVQQTLNFLLYQVDAASTPG